MPMRSSHRARFYDTKSWNTYTAYVEQVLRPYNVTFVDAGDWAQDDALFEDPLHLSKRGAAIFSKRIGELLRAQIVQLADVSPK